MTDKNLSIFECLEADEIGVIEKKYSNSPEPDFLFLFSYGIN